MSDQSARIRTKAISGATATWFPANTDITGSISSTDIRVVGLGSTFKTEISEGDFLVDNNNIARKVARVESDTELYIEAPYSSDLSGVTCTAVKNQELRHLRVFFKTNDGTLKTASQDTPEAWPAGQFWESPSTLSCYLEPILVTPGAAGAHVAETI